jgi:tartrate dehydratase beta subunit/fumarate hydratase class I family protein
MEFVLPVVFASGEAMIWILMITILVIIGKGKLLPSEKTLVIERKGQYRMVLAPGLNLAQPFIEAIAKQVSLREACVDGALLCFEVRDKNVATRKQPSYLLEIHVRDGELNFETRSAQTASHSAGSSGSHRMAGEIEKVVHAIGVSWGIGVQRVEHAAQLV